MQNTSAFLNKLFNTIKNKMKITKDSFTIIALISTISLSSCTVEYRTRHPRPVRHRHVVVVGMVIPIVPIDSTAAALVQQTPANKALIVINKKTK
jgi:hypothetical protein